MIGFGQRRSAAVQAEALPQQKTFHAELLQQATVAQGTNHCASVGSMFGGEKYQCTITHHT
jgi:hypothetical protein